MSEMILNENGIPICKTLEDINEAIKAGFNSVYPLCKDCGAGKTLMPFAANDYLLKGCGCQNEKIKRIAADEMKYGYRAWE
jgi:hypothetical protein